ADQNVDGLWFHQRNERLDFLTLRQAGRVEYIGSSLRIRLKPAHGFLERLRVSDEITLRPRRKQYSSRRSVNRRPRRLNALDRHRQIVQRFHAISSTVFDG